MNRNQKTIKVQNLELILNDTFLNHKVILNIREKIGSILCLAFALTLFNCGSSTTATTQNSTATTTTTTVEAKDTDISDNLDLEAVASVFGESKDLEDFEKRLNNPETKISNLDLNKDGKVDYLRVLSSDKGDEKVITIQSVLAKDKFQDVATIDVKKENTSVQVIGNSNIYGPNYFIYPVYGVNPLIMDWFWGPYYSPWISPFYWGYYPPYFRPWGPFSPFAYHNNIIIHVNTKNVYHHTNFDHHHGNMNNNHNRNDHYSNSTKQTFQKRNPRNYNKHSLDLNRGGTFTRSNFGGGFHAGGGFRR
ncbi:hypothetical protein ACJOV8_002515 [Formosa sp. 3Alg 14/1]|uniref:hypothetical protein n=1 Tax=Formosa sp. 3Alg 14/1 TaxID=3382190 RepID=UPI0039BE8FE8